MVVKVGESHTYLNIKDIQEMTGLSYLTIYRQFKDNKIIGGFQLGTRWMVSVGDWNNHIRKLKDASKSTADIR